MNLIKWNDSFSVNVEEIDKQHQTLVAMINELHDAMGQGKGGAILSKIVDDLIGYTATHFKTEEKYFIQFGYVDTDSHVKEHAAFVKTVTEFKAGVDSGKIFLTSEVMNFLSDWLQNHIKRTDRKYSECFNQNGLN